MTFPIVLSPTQRGERFEAAKKYLTTADTMDFRCHCGAALKIHYVGGVNQVVFEEHACPNTQIKPTDKHDPDCKCWRCDPFCDVCREVLQTDTLHSYSDVGKVCMSCDREAIRKAIEDARK